MSRWVNAGQFYEHAILLFAVSFIISGLSQRCHCDIENPMKLFVTRVINLIMSGPTLSSIHCNYHLIVTSQCSIWFMEHISLLRPVFACVVSLNIGDLKESFLWEIMPSWLLPSAVFNIFKLGSFHIQYYSSINSRFDFIFKFSLNIRLDSAV